MLLLVGAALGLVAGLLTGGSLQNLLARRLRWPLLVVAAFLIRELEIHTPLATSSLAPATFVLSLLVLIGWTIWHREELPGVLLVTAGMALNLAVVLANGGRMPVATSVAHLGPAQLQADGVWAEYTVMGPGTRFGWLGDWILMPQPIGRLFWQAYSPGDLVSLVGITIVLFLATRPRRTPTSQGAITTP
ncbi:MAG TPA: DUF5317 family protein [Candidatus Dormibacteraeota bacterium]|nr:DUF5317 family protein [Candidatus Dormibacteraeota bacterium]